MEEQNTAYKLDNSKLIAGIQKEADRNLVTDFIPTSEEEIGRLIDLWDHILLKPGTPKEMKPKIQKEINGYYALLFKKGELARDIFKVSADDFDFKARAQDIKDVNKTFPDVENAKERYTEQNKQDSKKSLVIVAKNGKDVEQFTPDFSVNKAGLKVTQEAFDTFLTSLIAKDFSLKEILSTAQVKQMSDRAMLQDSGWDDIPKDFNKICDYVTSYYDDNSEREENIVVDSETELNENNTDEPMTLRDIGIQFKEFIAKDQKQMAISLIDSTLAVGHYTPKKSKQTARCWTPEERIIWIKKMSKGTIILGKDKPNEGPTSKIENKPVFYDISTAKGLDDLRDVLSKLFKSEDVKEIEKAHPIIKTAFEDSQYDENLIRKWTELIASGNTEEDHLDILMPKVKKEIDTSDFDVWLVDAVKILSLEEIKEKKEYKSMVKRAEEFIKKTDTKALMQDKELKFSNWNIDTHILSFYDGKHPLNDEGEPVATVSKDVENVSTEQEIVAKDTNQENTTSDYLSLKELKELVIKESKKLSIDEICTLGPVAKLVNQSKANNSFAKHKHLRKYVANIYDTTKHSDDQEEEIVYPNDMNEVKLIGTKMIIEDGYGVEGMVIWLKKFIDNLEVLNLPTEEKIKDFIKSFFKDSFTEALVEKHGPIKKDKISVDEIKAKVKEFVETGEKEEETQKQPMGVYIHTKSLFTKAGYSKMELQEIKSICNEIIDEVNPKILEKYNQDKKDREEIRESKIVIDDKVFVKELLATSNPELWEEVKDITTLSELENKALELSEGHKWPEALNMSIDLISSKLIENAEDMTQEEIVDWFRETVLQAQSTEDNVETKELDEKYEGEDSDKWDTLKEAYSKNDYKHAVDDVLVTFPDRQNLNKDIITAIRASTGKYVSKQGNRKDAELHKFINNRRNNLANPQK